jgi:DNA-binding response OmpR family regulator
MSISASGKLNVVVYSSDSSVRAHVVASLGKRVASDLPELSVKEVATGDGLRQYIDEKKRIDLFVLDGEAHPEGGMGLAKQLKDELFDCPKILLLVARQQDSWLATWSRADAAVLHPADPFVLADKAAKLLRVEAGSTLSLR